MIKLRRHMLDLEAACVVGAGNPNKHMNRAALGAFKSLADALLLVGIAYALKLHGFSGRVVSR